MSETKSLQKTRYCVGFIFNTSHNLVLLIQKKRPAWQRGKLNGIGGHIEAGETGLDAMVRECEEETGLVIPAEAWSHDTILTGENFILDVFSTVHTDLLAARDMTDEHTLIIDTQSALAQTAAVMPNLPVLLTIARDRTGITKPVRLYDGIANP